MSGPEDLAAVAASLAATAEKLAAALSSAECLGNLLAEARHAGFAEGRAAALGEMVEELPVAVIFEAGRTVGQAATGARRATLHSLPGGGAS